MDCRVPMMHWGFAGAALWGLAAVSAAQDQARPITTLQAAGVRTAVHSACEPNAAVTGDSQIRGKFADSEIVITTTSRLAGAIHSLTWNGQEFIDSTDHGRQLQSAASFDCLQPESFWPECYNPTEAGSRADGAGPVSSSRLISISANGALLESCTQMAFWLAPGERSEGRLAKNPGTLSDHRVCKRVQIGFGALHNVIDYQVTFVVPPGEQHTFAQFEAVTGYMPAVFEKFWTYDAASQTLMPVSDGPGEQPRPVVLATASGAYAMGVYSPQQPSPGFEQAGYGRFRFGPEQVVKWNCAFRVKNDQGVPPGKYSYQLFVIVGTQEDVRRSLAELHRLHSMHATPCPLPVPDR